MEYATGKSYIYRPLARKFDLRSICNVRENLDRVSYGRPTHICHLVGSKCTQLISTLIIFIVVSDKTTLYLTFLSAVHKTTEV